MTAATATYDRGSMKNTGMKTPVVISAIFHGVIVVLALTGLPYFKSDPKPTPVIVPVEIMTIGEVTQTNKIPVKAPPKEEPKEEAKPIKKEAPPKVEAVEPPKDVPKPKPKAEAKPKPKPVVPPPPTEKLKEPEPKPQEKVKEEVVEPDQQEQFDSLLKNLQDGAPDIQEDLPESKTAQANNAPDAPLGSEMTITEIDAMIARLRQQLSRCWSIQAGARYAEDLSVEVRMVVSRERRVINATIVDQWRYNQDTFFRAAADSVIRALNSPQCEILDLPPDRYDAWKDMVVNFNPNEML
jgi:hypothetical protein